MRRTTDPLADPARAEGWRYVVDPPTVDFAAQALQVAQDAAYKDNPDAPRNAHLWSVREVPND